MRYLSFLAIIYPLFLTLIIAGLALQMIQKGGLRNLRTLAKAYTDTVVRQSQGKLGLEATRQLKEVVFG